jgi:hypothetical protein
LYKPLGDAVIDFLDKLARNPSSDPYRDQNRDYSEDGRWRCPVYVGLRVFDLMVTEALHRETHWHMWLMYLEYWTGRIVKNMADLGPDIDLSREHPTPYHYLLYEIFNTLTEWLSTAANLDEDLASVKIDAIDLDYGSIPKSAAISLGVCLRTAVESPNLTPKFKGYLLDVVAYEYSRIAEKGRPSLTGMYELAVMGGGREDRDNARFRTGVAEAVGHVSDDSHYMNPAAHFARLDAA